MINYNKIKKMYEDNHLSVSKIAIKTGFSKWKVREALKKSKAKMRSTRRIEPSNAEHICYLYESGKTMHQVVKITGDTWHVVFRTLHENNIKIRHGVELNEEEICKLYVEEKKTLKEICKIVGCNNVKRIINILDNNNVENRQRKYKLDENIFEKIDTPEKAYLLGFIYADGSVYNNVLYIGQSGEEHKILYKLKDILKTDKPVYKGKITAACKKQPYSLSITSNKIISNLLQWGVVQNKTLIIRFPQKLNNNLTSHFIRGYFDGDGYFYIKKDRRAVGFWALCSHKEFCQDIQKQFKKYNINSKIYQNKRSKNSWELRIGKFSEISKLYQFLYFNSNELFIPRKHDSFLELFNRKG